MKPVLKIHTLIAWVSFGCMGAAFATSGLTIIPQPQHYEAGDGVFQISESTAIYADECFGRGAQYLAEHLRVATGYEVPLHTPTEIPGNGQNTIRFRCGDAEKDGYKLNISPDGIEIAAPAQKGSFYAAVTLIQLLDRENKTIPSLSISDWPRFKRRGLMMDCSRTFQSIEYLKKTIDRMALYKMNVLHLHLTDDQAWRLEIKRHPELTEKTACFPAKYNEPAHRNGYYTQQQMKDLVKYAADRNIEITPEIEMPGHSLSVFACYPELSCTGEPVELYPFYQGSNITEDVFCAGNEAVFGFLKNVLAEVAEIFPSKYIHIGGDEAPTTHWESCSKCQVRMKQENLSDEHALQGYFMNRMAEYVNSIGKQMIGWDEIIEGELPPNSTLMWWRGRNQAGLTAAEAGHDVIMSPRSHCYFDYTYQTLSTRTCYSFEPIPKELSAGKEKHVLGLQANFWSAVDREPDQVDRQLWPRLLAIAERGWSEKTVRDWEDFSRRVEAALPRLAELGVAYHPETKKIQIGKWATGDVTEEYAPLTFDITENLSGSEPCRVLFEYTGGACRLAIENVELLADSKVVSDDTHYGRTARKSRNNEYTLRVNEYKDSVHYELRAYVKSDGGLNSEGKVYIIEDKKPVVQPSYLDANTKSSEGSAKGSARTMRQKRRGVTH